MACRDICDLVFLINRDEHRPLLTWSTKSLIIVLQAVFGLGGHLGTLCYSHCHLDIGEKPNEDEITCQCLLERKFSGEAKFSAHWRIEIISSEFRAIELCFSNICMVPF